MAISTNPKPTIYRNLYENTGHVFCMKIIIIDITYYSNVFFYI